MVAWPGWSVQQDLGSLSGSVGTFQIWASTGPGAFRDATVRASLIDATTREVVRQTALRVSRAYIPTQHTLSFLSYVVPHEKRLMLQLGVRGCERCHVIYRLANPDARHPNVMLNGVPNSGPGPLSFAHITTGSGLRAGIAGDSTSRVRLVLAAVSAMLAVVAHPFVVVRLRRPGIAAWRLARLLRTGARRLVTADASRLDDAAPARFHRLAKAPLYPWLVSAAPILHFAAGNPLHFSPVESIVPLAATLAAVTGSVVGLRFVLKDWNRSAAVSTVVIVVIFGYGHAADVIGGRIDDGLVLGGAAVLAAIVAVPIARASPGLGRWNQFLNLTTVVLLVFPVASLVGSTVQATLHERSRSVDTSSDSTAHLPFSTLPHDVGKRPDIYYIILDSYARNDALVDLFSFDNSEFLRELESRGFYIASRATSNYIYTIQSTPSILNMQYLTGLGDRAPETRDDLIDIARFHTVASILKNLGYTYIHLGSGTVSTELSPLADEAISFTPSGTVTRSGADMDSRIYAGTSGALVSTRFIRALVQSTALQPVLGAQWLVGESEPYTWWSPHRAIQMFEFLSSPIAASGPKFVFAHIVKPHDPATFDKDGNQFDDHRGFDDYHDPSVPSAYVGQLIYVNKLVLDMIDGILEAHESPPVIVIAGDHGRGTSVNHRHSILAAFHLPDGGSDGLYHNISSVNHFRYILDFYFDLGMELLDDQLFSYSSDHYDFRE